MHQRLYIRVVVCVPVRLFCRHAEFRWQLIGHNGYHGDSRHHHGKLHQITSAFCATGEKTRPFVDRPVLRVGGGIVSDIYSTAVLGIRNEENLFVDSEGSWQGKYIPAFIRRYPFVFAASEDGKNFTLCVDEEFSGCNQSGVGERLFDSEGERTQYLNSVLNFLRQYEEQFQRTRQFCQRLIKLGLLEDVQARFQQASGAPRSVGGFKAISRARLKELPGDTLAEMASTDELELAYLHLASLGHFNTMLGRGPDEASSESGTPARSDEGTTKPGLTDAPEGSRH